MTEVIAGDCVDVMATMDAASVDAIVTDPPYGLEFMGKEWDRLDVGLPQENVWKGRRGKGGSNIGTDDSKPGSRHHVALGVGKHYGFNRCQTCGKRQFSGSPCVCPEPVWEVEHNEGAPTSSIRMQRWHEVWAREALRVAKPGAHLLAFGGTRTYHRLTCALEDAGWEIRDCLVWAYASGFPKSLDVSKAIDKAAGVSGVPVTPQAKRWQGWGTALKPAWEPIVLARKPLTGTVAGNVERYGTGALNIDGTRLPVAPDDPVNGAIYHNKPNTVYGQYADKRDGVLSPMAPQGGRWPPNLLLTDELFGEASRFFLVPKASRSDREPVWGEELAERPVEERNQYATLPDRRMDHLQNRTARRNTHPTTKPVDLMRHLVRLVTPPGGTVLDPFLGSGTTAIAAIMEGFSCVGIEREPEYVAIAQARLNGVQQGFGLHSPEAA